MFQYIKRECFHFEIPPSKSYIFLNPASFNFLAHLALLPPDLQYKITGLLLSNLVISSSNVGDLKKEITSKKEMMDMRINSIVKQKDI